MAGRLLNIVLMPMFLSMAVSVLIVLSERWHGKHSLDHDLEGVQKFHSTAVPRIGGIAVFFSITLTLLFCNSFVLDLLLPGHIALAAFLVVAGLPAFIAGISEDCTKKVSVRVRLIASIISALVASWLLGATVEKIDIWGLDTLLTWMPFALAVTALVVSGGVNAVNIIDGFNGLAAGAVVIMLAALGTIGWHVGDFLVAELAMLGLGAAAGFLIINYPTGRLFLGDGGAYFLGFWVAEVGVLLLVRNVNINAWQVLSICAYPVIEVLYSIYRRKFLRQASPGSADGLHLHTLIYRRGVARFFANDEGPQWRRNAAVSCVILPCVAIAGWLSVVVGNTMLGSIGIVVAQILIYVTVYARLVRGRWSYRRITRVVTQDDPEVSGSKS